MVGVDVDAVLAAATRRERWALAVVFRAYQPLVLRYLRAQAPSAADDLASEVWIAVMRGLDRFSGGEAEFRSRLFTIARRRLIDFRRKARRRRTDPFPQEHLDRATAARDGGDPAYVVLTHVAAKQAIDLIVTDLSPEQADAVLLRVVAGLDVPDVARIIGRSPGAVRVLCHRALRRLASRLSESVVAE